MSQSEYTHGNTSPSRKTASRVSQRLAACHHFLPSPKVPAPLASQPVDWFGLLLTLDKWNHKGCVLLCVWVLSLNMTFTRFLPVVRGSCCLFNCVSIPLCARPVIYLSILLSMDILVLCTWGLLKSNTALNILYVFWWHGLAFRLCTQDGIITVMTGS